MRSDVCKLLLAAAKLQLPTPNSNPEQRLAVRVPRTASQAHLLFVGYRQLSTLAATLAARLPIGQCYARASMRKAEPGGSSPAPPLLPSSGVIQANVSAAAALYAPSSASSAACQACQHDKSGSGWCDATVQLRNRCLAGVVLQWARKAAQFW